MKKLQILFIFILILSSCTSVDKTNNIPSLKIENFTFVSPIYSNQENAKTINFFNRYKNYTTKQIDTLFKNNNKLPSQLMLEGKQNEIKNIFEAVKKNDPIKLSEKIKSETANEKHVAFTKIEPTIEGKSYVMSCKFEMVILDVKSDEIVFYGESTSKVAGYGKQLHKSFKRVYSMLK